MSNKDKIRNQMFDLLKFLSAILLILHHFQMEMGGTKLKYVNFFDGAFYESRGWIFQVLCDSTKNERMGLFFPFLFLLLFLLDREVESASAH